MRSLDPFRNRRALAWAIGIMLLFGAMATTRHHFEMMDGSMGGEYLTWRHAFGMEAPRWILWALAIPLIYTFVDRVARRGWSWAPAVFAHLAFAVLVILGATALLGSLSTSIFTYAAILGGVLAYYHSQRAVERDVELAAARLHALEAQLRPHFMFNALNSVAMLVRGGRGPEAVEMIARLSDLLRDSLAPDDRVEVTLAEEVALARRYLAVEEVRFADRLTVRVELTEPAKAARVPRLILQPVVENAVRHGIGQRAAAGHIEITASTSNGALIVVVRDDGPGPNGAPHGNGVGLTNTRERLQTMYGSAASMTLESGDGGGAVATLVVPLR
jgi:hypothetical protein